MPVLLVVTLVATAWEPSIEAVPKTLATPTAFEIVTSGIAGASPALGSRIAKLQEHAVRARDGTSLEQLGWTFVEVARAAQDDGFYQLALATAQAIDEVNGNGDAADLLRGHALLSLHRFAEAEDVAQRLAARRGIAADYGLLGDTRLDRGRVGAAVRAYQRMVNLRPDHRAYARVALARHATGDLDGAIDAMKIAAAATSPRNTDAYAWTRAKLAGLLLTAGRIEDALRIAGEAIDAAPESAVALSARGRVLLAAERPVDAIVDLRRAAEIAPLPSTLWSLEEALLAAGRSGEARAIRAQQLADGESADPRSFAVYLGERALDSTRALTLARAELERRGDAYTWDALSAAELAAGMPDDAWQSHERAARNGIRDAQIDLHGAEAAQRTGRSEEARRLVELAVAERAALLPSQRERLARLCDELDEVRADAASHP